MRNADWRATPWAVQWLWPSVLLLLPGFFGRKTRESNRALVLYGLLGATGFLLASSLWFWRYHLRGGGFFGGGAGEEENPFKKLCHEMITGTPPSLFVFWRVAWAETVGMQSGTIWASAISQWLIGGCLFWWGSQFGGSRAGFRAVILALAAAPLVLLGRMPGTAPDVAATWIFLSLLLTKKGWGARLAMGLALGLGPTGLFWTLAGASREPRWQFPFWLLLSLFVASQQPGFSALFGGGGAALAIGALLVFFSGWAPFPVRSLVISVVPPLLHSYTTGDSVPGLAALIALVGILPEILPRSLPIRGDWSRLDAKDDFLFGSSSERPSIGLYGDFLRILQRWLPLGLALLLVGGVIPSALSPVASWRSPFVVAGTSDLSEKAPECAAKIWADTGVQPYGPARPRRNMGGGSEAVLATAMGGFDVNQDGFLDAAEYRNYGDEGDFFATDSDADGRISATEFSVWFRYTQPRPRDRPFVSALQWFQASPESRAASLRPRAPAQLLPSPQNSAQSPPVAPVFSSQQQKQQQQQKLQKVRIFLVGGVLCAAGLLAWHRRRRGFC